MKPTIALLFAVLLCLCVNAGAQQHRYVIREQTTVNVDGQGETWQLVWDGAPKESSCGPREIDMAITCACYGFAYGQEGKLLLVRHRAGKQLESFSLDRYFGDDDNPVWQHHGTLAVLQRWGDVLPKDVERDSTDDEDPTLVAEILRRPSSTILKLADYDHDGRATEFLLHVDNEPCGKEYDVAVGISRVAPRLHALSSMTHPDKALVLPRWAWNALLQGPGEHRVVELECDDHASEVHQELVLSAERGRIRVRRESYSCPFNAAVPNLTARTEL